MIQLAQAGDEDAFGELYERNVDAITRFIQHRVNDLEETENLTQIVFVKAWQALGRYQPTKAPFRAWLYRIAGNTVIDYYRTRKDATDIDSQWHLADQQTSPEEAALSAERSETVRNALTQLKPSYQQVLSLRFIDERDYPETALLLERKVNAVRVLQHRALAALQEVLSNEQAHWIVTFVAVLTLAFGGSITLAAEGSVPGDSLYPIKRTIESLLLDVAGNTLDVRLQVRFANRRVEELSRLINSGREADLTLSATEYIEQVQSMTASLLMLLEAEPGPHDTLTADVLQALEAQTQRLSKFSSRGADAVAPAVEQSMAAARQAQVAIKQLAPAEQVPTPILPTPPSPPAATPAPKPNSVSEQSESPGHAAPARVLGAPATTGDGIEGESALIAQPGGPIAGSDDVEGAPGPSIRTDKQLSTQQPQDRAIPARQQSELQTQPIDLLPQAAMMVQTLLTDLDLTSRPSAPFSPPRVAPRQKSMDSAPSGLENELPTSSNQPRAQNAVSPPQQGPHSNQPAPVHESNEAPPNPDAAPLQPLAGSDPAGNEWAPDQQNDGSPQNREAQDSKHQQNAEQGRNHASTDTPSTQQAAASSQPDTSQTDTAQPATSESQSAGPVQAAPSQDPGGDEADVDHSQSEPSQNNEASSMQPKDHGKP